jgi:hypothetical protein
MIANTPETAFLLQPELLAIKNGLKYKENIKGVNCSGNFYTSRGYVNADRQIDGVAIKNFDKGTIISGEYRNGKCSRVLKFVNKDGQMYWGQVKNDINEGFGELIFPDGRKYCGQF